MRAIVYVMMFAFMVATAISWHASPVVAGLLALLAAFAVELIAPGDEE